MIWRIYIARQKFKSNEYWCQVERLDLPGTTQKDMKNVVKMAARKYDAVEDAISAIPLIKKSPPAIVHNYVRG